MTLTFETLKTRAQDAVLFVEIAAPPMNLIGTALVTDLVALVQLMDSDAGPRVVVLSSADPDFFVPHVDLTQITAYREAAAKLTGEASIGMLFRRVSQTKSITIAQIEGRVRGAGSELALACDMRFAARESAIFGQIEAGTGAVPGAGGIQHLTRLLGRGRALEVLLSSDDFDAETAERYGWINRALPRSELGAFVARLALRIAAFPTAGLRAIKARVDEISLASEDAFRRDSDLFGQLVQRPEAQARLNQLVTRGLQTRGPTELELGKAIGELD